MLVPHTRQRILLLIFGGRAQIRSALETYTYIYIFSVDNMRNIHLKDVRTDWSTSRYAAGHGAAMGRAAHHPRPIPSFFLGKNRVMALALGPTVETEQHKGLSELAQRITGQVGIFMTNEKPKKVTDYFARFVKTEYARGGFVPSESIVVPEGQVMAGVEPVVHTLEPMLRRLGLPTQLKNGARPLRICLVFVGVNRPAHRCLRSLRQGDEPQAARDRPPRRPSHARARAHSRTPRRTLLLHHLQYAK